VLFIVAVGTTIVVVVVAVWLIFAGSENQQTWAASALTAVVSGLVGYLTGGRS